ncbi:MAG: hypothetical protein ABI664_13905 [bacterium]
MRLARAGDLNETGEALDELCEVSGLVFVAVAGNQCGLFVGSVGLKIDVLM